MTYAKDLRVWFAFLEKRDMRWDEAERADIRAFQIWRVYDDRNPSRVTAATWNKGWAALNHFYGWAHRSGWVEGNPVGKYDRLRPAVGQTAYREKNARVSRDRWITPGDYAFWSRVGFAGYSARLSAEGRAEAAFPDSASRARNISRNLALADYVLVTGLRLSEVGTLLLSELPSDVGQETPIIGKGNVRRHYRPMHRSGLESVDEYIRFGRVRAVRRAQREGRYADVRSADLIESVSAGPRGLQLRMHDGRTESALTLSASRRSRLFRQGESGIEPAGLWLTEHGTPMLPSTWSKVFETANLRASRERQRVRGIPSSVRVTPHSLRFTFALYTLLAGVRAMDARLGISPAAPFLPSSYSQVFDEVRDLLGHANSDVTRNIYLEPVKSLRRTDLLRLADLEAFWDRVTDACNLVGFRA